MPFDLLSVKTSKQQGILNGISEDESLNQQEHPAVNVTFLAMATKMKSSGSHRVYVFCFTSAGFIWSCLCAFKRYTHLVFGCGYS